MPGTVGLRFNIDTSQAQTSVDDLSDSIVTLGNEIRNAEAAAAAGTGSWDEVARLYQSLNNATSARGQIMNQTRQANQANQANNNNAFSGQLPWMFQTALNQITRGIIQSMDAALSAAKQRASGDYSGAAVTQVRAEGEIAGQGIGAGVGFGIGAGLTALTGQAWLMPLLAGLGAEVGKFLGGIEAKKLETDLAYSSQYKKVFPEIDSLNQLYGTEKYTDENGKVKYRDINGKTLEQNNTYGLEMHGRAAEATEGTGLTTQAFIEAMKQMSAYGVKTESQALDMAHLQALWSRFTGADLGTIQKFAGKSYRFGGDTGAVSTAYGALTAQNMGKGQFSEFLTSMERILEEGISKGFIRSSEEIAGNMQMLYKLSGGSRLWQGEQGAQRLSQMNMAISNATNLQSVEDVITFGVARELLGVDNPNTSVNERKAQFMKYGGESKYYTGTYVDEMQLLERGVSADLLKGQFSAVSKLEGNNVSGIIERFKSMYGLNYTGAAQVYSMMEKARDGDGNFNFNAKQYEDQIKAMKADPKYASDSTLLQKAINDMTENLVNIGKFKFDSTEWAMLESQAKDVASILAELKGEKHDPLPGVSEEVLRERTNKSLPVSHSMIFNDAAIKPGTTGVDAYNQIKERYFSIIQDHDERRFLSEAPAMQELMEFIPRAIADGEFSTTGRNNDFDHANKLLNDLERNLPELIKVLQGLTEKAEEIRRDGLPIGDVSVTVTEN